jgi:hypothetical protein
MALYDVYCSIFPDTYGFLVHVAPAGTVVGSGMNVFRKLQVELTDEDIVTFGSIAHAQLTKEEVQFILMSQFVVELDSLSDTPTREEFFAVLTDRLPAAAALFELGIRLRM